MKQNIDISSVTLLLLALAVNLGVTEAMADDPENTVTVLLNAPHGLTDMSGPEVKNALQLVLKSPDVYITLFAAAAKPDTAQMHLDEYRNRTGNAIAVIQRIGGPQAEEVLAERFADFNRLLEDENVKKDAARNATLLRNMVVESFAASGSDRLVASVLTSLKNTDVASYHVYMTYLQDVGGKKAGIVERIKAASAQAGRENWPITQQTLQKLEKSTATSEATEEPRQVVPTASAASQSSTAGTNGEQIERPGLQRKLKDEAPVSSSLPAVVWAAIAAVVAILAVVGIYYWRRK